MTDNKGSTRRKRARLACTVCNARRVKCNVTESRPCNNCVASGTACETRESRRGKHPRKPRDVLAGTQNNQREGIDQEPGAISSSPEHTIPQNDEGEVLASRILTSLSLYMDSSAIQPEPSSLPNTNPPQDIASIAIETEPEDDAAVFLGESSSLRYVPDERTPIIPSPRRSQLRHPVPNALKAAALMPQWETERRQSRIKTLQADGAFSFPTGALRQELLEAYFQWFHAHFAIVDEPDIWTSHSSSTISPLLLQAMLFIGVIHCNESVLVSLGCGNRQRAKYLFYTRAKDIYDSEYETSKLTVIQSLFLMSFWRAGALLEKDARHWLGAAISLAQTIALHRSAAHLDKSAASLRRRIWWSIYIRERQCGSALGLPNRIRDEDCDVEWLSPSDFQNAFDLATPSDKTERYISYMLGITELARALGRVVDAGYLPDRTLNAQDRAEIREELYHWKLKLSPAMELSSDAGGTPDLLASMLHLVYNNLLILLHRSSFINNVDDNGNVDGNVALQAAARNSRIMEDLLSDGKIKHAQIHVITNLFNTLCIHVVHLKRSTGINRTIAEHRAKLCLLGLQELQVTWDVTNWVLQLFFQYLDRSTAARLATEGADTGIISAETRQTTPMRATTQEVVDTGLMGSTGGAVGTNTIDPVMIPLSWTTDEANKYLFSQIKNDFAFGEGGMLEWSSDGLLTDNGSMISEFGLPGLGQLP
ncbi:cutinase transcription factor 1 alpha [Lophiostoma macrostomum CBS 122681]|uniref:Cutinase transcription factor 1 alpha n=1 Tax=Lophiostoma macrostomum CBS 122681 TaxID=1314788 RepID=A0A6A6T7N3_9PLEO|nr:cutinase transcription factor 1 alpha [Lophiostoma macrostomum CBS 122681]